MTEQTEPIQTAAQPTKKCPFCAEVILAEAIKCKHCGEFLNTDRARAAGQTATQQNDKPQDNKKNILLVCRPSLWNLAGFYAKGLIVFLFAAWLTVQPIENVFNSQNTADAAALVKFIQTYRPLTGFGIALMSLAIMVWKTIALRAVYYEISAERIEHGRGVFNRKVDNIDMFRVVDISLRQSFIDVMLGIGSVKLTTNDKSSPELVFQKIRHCRRLYDIIKKTSLEADRKQKVVHLE